MCCIVDSEGCGAQRKARMTTMVSVAERARIPGSATVGMQNKAAEMKAAGINVLSLAAGEPDFVTPAHIREYAKKALDEGYTFYPPSSGLPQLRQAIANKLAEKNGIHVDSRTEIIVTVGGKQAIFSSILAMVDPGDEVIVSDPCWVTYDPCVKLAGGRTVPVPVREEDGLRISPDAVSRAITRKSKLIILNSPCNPTGAVLRREDLDPIAELAKRNDLWILSDEIYEFLIYDGLKHYSIASLPGMQERTVTANGFSKAYSMTGWRLGYLAGPRQLVEHILAIHEHSVTGPALFIQKAMADAMEDPRSAQSISEMHAEFEKRRELMVGELNKIPGTSCMKPGGTFYAFPNVTSFKRSSSELARYLLEKAQVAVIPGSAFGKGGEGFLRLSFAASADNIKEALSRIRSALSNL